MSSDSDLICVVVGSSCFCFLLFSSFSFFSSFRCSFLATSVPFASSFSSSSGSVSSSSPSLMIPSALAKIVVPFSYIT